MSLLRLPFALWALSPLVAASGPVRPELPAWFEPLSSGTPAFVSRGANSALLVDRFGATAGAHGLRIDLVGSKGARSLEGIARREATTSYYVGNQRSRWRGNVPQFDKVLARSVYRGIDAVYYTTGKTLEYDFVLAPGSDPLAIRLRFSQKPALSPDGHLVFSSSNVAFRQHAPIAYQVGPAGRILVESRYEISANGEVSFHLGGYDKSLPLTIDPVLSYAGYLGGQVTDQILAVAADKDGGYWVAGGASSTIPVPEGTPGADLDPNSGRDAFVAKIMPDGDLWKVVHFAYLGGQLDEEATAIAVKGNDVYLTGWTGSGDFPLGGEAFQIIKAGEFDAFIMRYSPKEDDPYKITYSTYFGGLQSEYGRAVAVDSKGRIAVAGYTLSGVLPGADLGAVLQPANRGGIDAFVVVANPFTDAGHAREFATFFGGDSTDIASAIAYDSQDKIWIAGFSASDDLPLAGSSYRTEPAGRGDIFLARIDPAQTGFDQQLYGTYIGGSDLDSPMGLAIDDSGRLWLTGYTLSIDFPVTPGAYQPSNAGSSDAFILAFDPKATGPLAVRYATYVGGKQGDVAYGLSLGRDGMVVIAGYTYSRDFPFKDVTGYEQPKGSLSESFVTAVDTAKTGPASLLWSGLFGGGVMDVAVGVALDSAGNPFVAGFTGSFELPVGNAPSKANATGAYTGFFFRLGPPNQ